MKTEHHSYTYPWLGSIVTEATGGDAHALQRLIMASHEHDRAYLAWELVRLGRAGELMTGGGANLGKVVINRTPKPYTGFEGFFAGATVADAIDLIVEAQLRLSDEADYLTSIVVDETTHQSYATSLANQVRHKLAAQLTADGDRPLTAEQLVQAEAGLGLKIVSDIEWDAQVLSEIHRDEAGEPLPYLSPERITELLQESILQKQSLNEMSALPELREMAAFMEELLAVVHPLVTAHPVQYNRFRGDTYALLDAVPGVGIHYTVHEDALTVAYDLPRIRDTVPQRETRVALPQHSAKAYDLLANIGWIGLPLIRQLLEDPLPNSETSKGVDPAV